MSELLSKDEAVETKHSPLPWKLHDHGVQTMGHGVVFTGGGAHRKVIIETADGKLAEFERLVFDVDDRRGVAQLEADARYFICAVNSHDALVAAARKAVNLMSYLHWESDPHGRKDKAEIYQELSDALIAAGEEV